MSAVNSFTFADLFSGIGGFRVAFEAAGGRCVFASEIDKFARRTYEENFSTDHVFVADIRTFHEQDVPDHDILLAGFPCQPFSLAGVSVRNALGRPHGFRCTTHGTLFFDVARILSAKRPSAFILENVKNLVSHDRGNTFRVILQTLRDELGYDVHWRIIDAWHFVPQHRERIFIVGFREKTRFSWDALRLPDRGPTLATILHRTDGSEPFLPWDGGRYFSHSTRSVNPRYTLTPKVWAYLQKHAEHHGNAGHGFGYSVVGPDSVARTLTARYYKDGSEILVDQGPDSRPRKLTPRECARLMGFPDDFRIPVSDMQAYRQFGNSVVVPLVRAIAGVMMPHVVLGQSGFLRQPELTTAVAK